jgi:serine/threonine protein kinase
LYKQFVTQYGTRIFQQYPQLQILQPVNKGSFGSIYVVIFDSKIMAVKLESNDGDNSKRFRKKIKQEFTVQRYCTTYFCAPHPHEFGFFQNRGREHSFIFMDKISYSHNTIGDLFKLSELPDIFYYILEVKIIRILNLFKKYRLVHGDLHWNNMYLVTNPEQLHIKDLTLKNSTICLLDFGNSSYGKESLPELELLSLYRSTYMANLGIHAQKVRQVLDSLGTRYKIEFPKDIFDVGKKYLDLYEQYTNNI